MRKILPILAMFFGLILTLAGIGGFVIKPKLQNPGTISIPKEISNEPLFLQQNGWRAMDELDRLHKQKFPLTAGSIGTYGSHQNVKLWVGETFWKIIANRMIIYMRDEIATGSSPFTPEGERFINDRTIYTFDGMGQKHFYFQSGRLIIWLAADENIAEQALYEILEYFP
jgi:hypothetical protein